MKPKHSILCGLLLAVAAAPAIAQPSPSQRLPVPRAEKRSLPGDYDSAKNAGAAEFANDVQQWRQRGQWNRLRELGRVRREAHPDEAGGWYSEGLGAYGDGDVDAAVAAWKVAVKIGGVPAARDLLATAEAVQRNYPGRNFGPLMFPESDVDTERVEGGERMRKLLLARDYDEIERVADELQKSKQTSAMGDPYLESFFHGVTFPDENSTKLQDYVAEWRAARPNSDLARLVEIKILLRLAWRVRGGGYADSITPAMSQSIAEKLEKSAQLISELSAKATESPLMFAVLQAWGQLAGDRALMDAVYREGIARFPYYHPILTQRIANVLPQWYGEPGETMRLVQAHADDIGGIEGDIAYALGYYNVHIYQREQPHDDARFWRGLDALRARYPDSTELRNVQIRFGEEQGDADGNYEHAKKALSEGQGNVLNETWFSTPEKQTAFAEHRMEILAKDKPR